MLFISVALMALAIVLWVEIVTFPPSLERSWELGNSLTIEWFGGKFFFCLKPYSLVGCVACCKRHFLNSTLCQLEKQIQFALDVAKVRLA